MKPKLHHFYSNREILGPIIYRFCLAAVIYLAFRFWTKTKTEEWQWRDKLQHFYDIYLSFFHNKNQWNRVQSQSLKMRWFSIISNIFVTKSVRVDCSKNYFHSSILGIVIRLISPFVSFRKSLDAFHYLCKYMDERMSWQIYIFFSPHACVRNGVQITKQNEEWNTNNPTVFIHTQYCNFQNYILYITNFFVLFILNDLYIYLYLYIFIYLRKRERKGRKKRARETTNVRICRYDCKCFTTKRNKNWITYQNEPKGLCVPIKYTHDHFIRFNALCTVV